jgi:hypothetical protein
MTELVETAPHEFNTQYNFDRGLDPYFAVDNAVKSGGGARKSTFEAAGETWKVTLYYQDSNIVHPGESTPTDTTFVLDEIREFRLSVEALEGDDQAGQKGFNAHLRPRWERMKVQNDYGDEQTLQIPFREGINVKIQGSNIEFQNYQRLLKLAFEAVDVNRNYFDSPHESSVVTQAERYVRINEDFSGPIHARDGPLARLGHLLEDDRDGRREIEQADTTEDGEKVPGYRHQVGLDERRVQEVFPDHSLPKRWKHYRARQSHNLDADNPLRHPKVGCIYYGSLWRDKRENHGVSPDEISQLTQELEDALLSVLHDAGLDVTSTAPYVSDDYFEAATSDRRRQVVDLPLEEIETHQEDVVIKHVSGGLSPTQWDSLETLVTDGGEIAPEDIADENDRHLDTVYRALEDMDELIDREYGSVSLRSTHVGQLVYDAIREARERTRDAIETTAKALEASERGLDRKTSALVAWASQYAENFRERDDGLEIHFGTIEADSLEEATREIRRMLREGKRLWGQARKDDMQWRQGTYRARVETPQYPDLRSLDGGTKTELVTGRLWEIERR